MDNTLNEFSISDEEISDYEEYIFSLPIKNKVIIVRK